MRVLLLSVAVLFAVAHSASAQKQQEPWDVLADWVEAVLSSDPYFRKLVRRERPTRLFLDTTWAPCCPSARLKCFEDCDVGVAKARALATLLHRSLPDASKNWAEVVDVAAVMFNGRLYYPGEAPDNPVEASDLLEAALWGHPDNPRIDATELKNRDGVQYFASFPPKVLQINSNDTDVNNGVVTRTVANAMNDVFQLTDYGLRPSSWRCGGGCCAKPLK